MGGVGPSGEGQLDALRNQAKATKAPQGEGRPERHVAGVEEQADRQSQALAQQHLGEGETRRQALARVIVQVGSMTYMDASLHACLIVPGDMAGELDSSRLREPPGDGTGFAGLDDDPVGIFRHVTG